QRPHSLEDSPALVPTDLAFGVGVQGSPKPPRGPEAGVLPKGAQDRGQGERRGQREEQPAGVLRQEQPQPGEGHGEQQCGRPRGDRGDQNQESGTTDPLGFHGTPRLGLLRAAAPWTPAAGLGALVISATTARIRQPAATNSAPRACKAARSSLPA